MIERIYGYWLLTNPTITAAVKVHLYEYFGDAYRVYMASREELASSGCMLKEGMLEEFLEQRKRFHLNEEYQEFMRGPYSFVTLDEDEYPYLLRTISGHPYGLYYYGVLPKNDDRCVAIVGARQPSAYGLKAAKELGEELAREGYVVVSGMARGIDAAGHTGALVGNGRTVAVLAGGIDVIYPRQNASLYYDIRDNGGCIMSEYPMGSEPIANQFPSRNRIIAGLCTHTVVVEARIRSGSLITADFCLEQGRELYAYPGRTTDPMSQGTNRLIAQGAGIITSPRQFIADMKELDGDAVYRIESAASRSGLLSDMELKVYGYFDYYPVSLTEIIEKTGLAIYELMPIVYALVEKGVLQETLKNTFVYV